MSIRLPSNVVNIVHNDQGGSVLGGWAYPFRLPQDTDNVTVKMNASVVAGGLSAIFQTSDDGGTTWYDCARTSIVSNSGATAAVGQNAQWLSIPTINSGVRTAATFAGASIVSAGIGAAAASTVAQGQTTGLPILGQANRIFLVSTGNATAVAASVTVMINQQSATA